MVFPQVPESPNRPPVPESPHRQLIGRSTGAPRAGMHLCQNDEEEDDVSSLTFHTVASKDTNTTFGSNSSFVKAARESLECKSLWFISEEGGSRPSSCNSESRSRASFTRSLKTTRSSKSSSSSTSTESSKPTAASRGVEEGTIDGEDGGTISLAESVLGSANGILESVGSLPYWRNKMTPPSSYESPQPSPVQPLDEVENCFETIHDKAKESASRTKPPVNSSESRSCASSIRSSKSTRSSKSSSSSTSIEEYKSSAVNRGVEEEKINDEEDGTISLTESIIDSANKVLPTIGSSPYYTGYESPQPSPVQSLDEVEHCSETIHDTAKESASPKKPSVDHSCQSARSSVGTRSRSDEVTKKYQKLQELESKTKRLQLLLKERQLETKKASKSLETSIKKAHELLRKYDAESNM